MPIDKNKFYGWKVLAALFAVGAIGPMTRYSITFFFPAISSELGWSRSEIGLAQSAGLWVYSFLAVLAGWMVDRYGSRKVIFIGGLACLAGWSLLSTTYSMWQLYLYYGLIMALATSNTHLVPTQATSRKWFIRRAGLASGIIGSALAVGNAILGPLMTSAASDFGWRSVCMVGAIVFSLPVLLLAWLVIRDTPESVGQHPDGMGQMTYSQTADAGIERRWSVGGALKTPRLWLLFISYGLTGAVANAIHAHIIIWGVNLGSTPAASGIFITLLSGPSIVARVAGGWVGDRYGKKGTLLIGTAASALVMLIAWQVIHTQLELMLFVPLMGIATGLANPLYAPYLGDLFGRHVVGSLFAILTLSWGLIGGFGPLVWGMIYDATGSYNLALLVSAGCLALALVALLLVRRPAEKT